MKKPDTDISPLLWVELNNGIGAIHVSTIVTILPDSSNPTKDSLIVTSVFTDGITVKGNASDLVMEWYDLVRAPEEEDFDEDDESRFQSIGDLIAECMATEIEDDEEYEEAVGQLTSDEFTGLKLVNKEED